MTLTGCVLVGTSLQNRLTKCFASRLSLSLSLLSSTRYTRSNLDSRVGGRLMFSARLSSGMYLQWCVG